jgi:hypothetical protein
MTIAEYRNAARAAYESCQWAEAAKLYKVVHEYVSKMPGDMAKRDAANIMGIMRGCWAEATSGSN